MTDFKTGDVVQLNSGGPFMTVTSVNLREDKIATKWFVDQKVENGLFPSGSLKHVRESQPVSFRNAG